MAGTTNGWKWTGVMIARVGDHVVRPPDTVIISNNHGTTYVNPSTENLQSSQSHWEIRMSGSRGVPYFYNSVTKTSVWETPDGLTREEIANLPGAEYLTRPAKVRASHLLVKHSGSRNPSSWREVWCNFRFLVLPLTTIFSPGQNNPFEGRSYRDPPRLQNSDQRIPRDIRSTRKRVFGL